MDNRVKVLIETKNEQFYTYLTEENKLPDFNDVYKRKNTFHGMDMIGLYDMNHISQTRIYRKDIICVKLFGTENILTNY